MARHILTVRLRERQKFRIDWAGRDHVNGHDVVVIDYQEVAPNRNNPDQHFYELFGFTASIVRGRLWIDAATFQLRRERWEFAGFIQRCHSPSPVSAVKQLIPKAGLASLFPNASCSDFGMPNRRRISHHPFSDPSARRVLTASSSNSRFRLNKRSERRRRPSSKARTYRYTETKPPSSNRRSPFPQLKIAVPNDDH